MIGCTNGRGHSLKAHSIVPGWSLERVCGGEGVIDRDEGDLMQRRGWRGWDLSGERGMGMS